MPTPESAFDFLRVSLETHLNLPSVITVTSALWDDGATTVATGLAQAFAATGAATLLVSTEPAPASASRSIETRSALTRATAEQITADLAGGRALLARAFPALREAYAVVVVSTEAVPESSFALELSREADAVLLAIRLGRRTAAADRTTKRLLEECKANVLGIVPTNAASLAAASTDRALHIPAIEVSQVRS
jgi:Mrp family chromosome partitioning ATPase